MSDNTNDRPHSRMADQPAPRPVGVPVPDAHRPTYEELQAQAAGVSYSALAESLDDDVRAALGLPVSPAPLRLDRAAADRIRGYFLTNPGRISALSTAARDELNL